MLNPARAHKQAALAAKAAEVDSLDNLEPYQKLQMQLAKDKQLLKAIKGIPDKAVAKAEMLPKYQVWLDQVLASRTAHKHDTVFVTAVLWMVDAGQIDRAVHYVEFAIEQQMQVNDEYQRSLTDLMIEEIAAQITAGSNITLANIEKIARLITEKDQASGLHRLNIYDQVRAKYLKAAAEWHEEQGGGTHKQRALWLYEKALQYNPRAGVKKRIEALSKQAQASQ